MCEDIECVNTQNSGYSFYPFALSSEWDKPILGWVTANPDTKVQAQVVDLGGDPRSD
jgi:hypothetical protein